MRKTLAVFSAVAVLGAGGTVVADRQIDPYTDKESHYELAIKSDIPQGERVEIHKDKAQMDLIGWNSEYKISIIPQIPTALLGAKGDKPFTVPADRPLLSKKMEYKSGNVTAFIEPKEGTENEFDIDFTLDSKPDTNVFTYKIEGAGEFDFFYQPALTQQEIDEGAERPENVEGSYAVYHKTKADHRIGQTNYATGKAFHIFRPKAIDANGAEVWAELSYADGVLGVTVPQKFLDDAAYPVKVDPTFGYTTQGGSTRTRTANGMNGTRFTSSADITEADSISLYAAFESSAGNVKMTITDVSRVLITNGVAPAVAVNGTVNVKSWRTSTYSSKPSITASTDYWLGYVPDVQIGVAYDAGTSNYQYNDNSNSYATPTNPSDGSLFADKYSIYVTYTCTGTCTETFTTTGETTWTAPTGVTSADVACWGGGGGGETDLTNSGAGGGGGAFASSTVAVTAGNNYTVTVASTSGATLPTTGKFSSFVGDDKTVKACGGTGATSRTANGVGGTTACSTGDVEAAGGDGADGSDPDGGGGGGAAGPNGAGVIGEAAGAGSFGDGGAGNNGLGGAGGNSSGEAGTSNSNGGGGGAGGDNTANGGHGGTPGGGGGGGAGSGGGPATGGTGAGGQCTITYTVSAGGGGTTVSRQSIIWFIED